MEGHPLDAPAGEARDDGGELRGGGEGLLGLPGGLAQGPEVIAAGGKALHVDAAGVPAQLVQDQLLHLFIQEIAGLPAAVVAQLAEGVRLPGVVLHILQHADIKGTGTHVEGQGVAGLLPGGGGIVDGRGHGLRQHLDGQVRQSLAEHGADGGALRRAEAHRHAHGEGPGRLKDPPLLRLGQGEGIDMPHLLGGDVLGGVAAAVEDDGLLQKAGLHRADHALGVVDLALLQGHLLAEELPSAVALRRPPEEGGDALAALLIAGDDGLHRPALGLDGHQGAVGAQVQAEAVSGPHCLIHGSSSLSGDDDGPEQHGLAAGPAGGAALGHLAPQVRREALAAPGVEGLALRRGKGFRPEHR